MALTVTKTSPAEPPSPPTPPAPLPRVVSLCGTWLKPEMQSIYRQVTGLQRYQSTVLTEQLQHTDQFPWPAVHLMTKQVRPRPRGNFIRRFWFKYIIRQWPPPTPPNKPPEPPHYPYDLPALLHAHTPDIVHAYYGHKAVKYLEMIQAWGGPWLVSFHGVDVVKFIHDPHYLAQLRLVFTRARLVLARSHSLLAALTQLGCPPEKLRLNRTPIPLDAFPYQPRTAPVDGRWQLVQACRLIGKKGLYTTLTALTHVIPHYPHLHWVICGQGPERDAFLAARDALGLTAHVTLAGWCDQAALRAAYARAHIFLHPSELTAEQDQEGIPNSMLEAMATGLPVLATTHGGIPEAVTTELDGLLVPEKDATALAAALLRLLGDPALYARLSAAAAASVRQHFSATSCLARLQDHYDEARAASPPSAAP